MDSINQNQPEDNHKDLSGAEGVKKLKELIDKASSCFFCTNTETGVPFVPRPMSVLKTGDDGKIYFMSSNDSNKNEQIKNDSSVQLLFQGSSHSDFLSISGTAQISVDKNLIKELWNPMLKTWFTEGVDDPRISVIIVSVNDSYYWDTIHALPVSFMKRMVGAVIGKTLDDSVEGTIAPH